MSAQSAAAAAPTTGVVPAAADQVSAQFATHAQIYQAVSAQAAAMHEMIVNTSATSAGSYAATEAANAIAAG
jgi:PE family